MALGSNISIVSVSEGVRFDLGGRATRTTIYKYTVGTDGPFTLEYDAGADTTDVVTAAMNAQAAKIAALKGNG
jgi:hypothetical protein